MKIALSIAGSDPSGGAGIQGDLKAFQALGVFGLSVITSITVQNTQKVFSSYDMPPEVVKNQILSLLSDMKIDVIKIGMVSNSNLVFSILEALKISKFKAPIIIDPVMISKSGYSLISDNTKEVIINELFPISFLVTPNIYESEQIIGMNIASLDDMKFAAEKIYNFGSKYVIIKGGHLDSDLSMDVAFNGKGFILLKSNRINTNNTHGTGCTFSSAVSAYIALGKSFENALILAKEYITGAIKHSINIGKGCGPTNHFFAFYKKTGSLF